MALELREQVASLFYLFEHKPYLCKDHLALADQIFLLFEEAGWKPPDKEVKMKEQPFYKEYSEFICSGSSERKYPTDVEAKMMEVQILYEILLKLRRLSPPDIKLRS